MRTQTLFTPKQSNEGRPPQYKIEIAFTLEPQEYEFNFYLVEGWYFEEFKNFYGPKCRGPATGTAKYTDYKDELKTIEEIVSDFMGKNYSVFELNLRIIHEDKSLKDFVIKEENIPKEAAVELFQNGKILLVTKCSLILQQRKPVNAEFYS